MNVLTYIKKNTQAVLAVVFVLFLLIPNILLSVDIEPLPYRFLCILLPFSLYVVWLFLFRKPSISMLFAIPLIIFDVYQVFLIYMFGPYISGVDMILNIFSSDNAEVGELLSTFIAPIIVGSIPLVVLIVLVVYSFRMKKIIALKHRKIAYMVSMPLLFVSFITLLFSKRGLSESLKNDVYPLNALYNVYLAGRRYYNIKTFEKRTRHFRFDAHSCRNKDERELYILLIGETSRAMNWQLYGYTRQTNPLLASLGNELLVYTDVLTQSNTTHKSVPIILSCADASNFSMVDSTKSFISAFKEAGFSTASITNQPPNGSYTDFFLHESDKFISLRSGDKSHKDMDMIPILDSIIKVGNKKQLIVIHSYGSHFNYYDRYDENMRVFTDKKSEKVSLSEKKVLGDTYDNAILYTDSLIYEVVKRVKTSEAKSTLLYIADHGEDLFDDERGRFLHATPDISAYQICVPFIVYSNEKYRVAYPDIYDSLRYNTDKPFQSDVVFHTMLSISGIETRYLNKSKSLSSHFPYTATDERLYVDDRNNCRSIWSMTRNYKLDYATYRNFIKQIKR